MNHDLQNCLLLLTKFKGFLSGVTEYFILDYRHEETAFYRLDSTGKQYDKIPLKLNDIIESKVLPGFRFRLSDMKKRTDRSILADDPVYTPYLLLGYQKIRRDRARILLEEDKLQNEILRELLKQNNIPF